MATGKHSRRLACQPVDIEIQILTVIRQFETGKNHLCRLAGRTFDPTHTVGHNPAFGSDKTPRHVEAVEISEEVPISDVQRQRIG